MNHEFFARLWQIYFATDYTGIRKGQLAVTFARFPARGKRTGVCLVCMYGWCWSDAIVLPVGFSLSAQRNR